MKLETFFDKFDQFTDAPNAVAKMREMILDLGAQGLLTERQADDGFASDIVEAIANERARLTAKKLIRKQTALPELSLDALPFAVPPSWIWVRLGDCVPSCTDDFVDGPFGSNLKADEYTDHGIPIVRLKNIGRNQFKTKDIKFIPEKKADELKRHSFKPGDLLLNKLGEPVGKCCIAPKELGGGIIVADVIRLRLSEELFDPRLVSYIINSPVIARQLLAQITGITRDRVNLEKLRNLAIPLPPLAEQKRIVAKVDELMALCDRLEAQQQERDTRNKALARASLARFAEAPTPANLDFLFHPSYTIPPADLRKSILTLAVQGKLVPQDPDDESAEILFSRIERDRGQIAKEHGVRLPKNVPELPTENCPHDIPDSWQWKRIGQLALVIDYGTSQKADSDSTKVPVYRMGNIVGGRLVDDNLKYVDANIDDLPGLYLKTNDILFNRTNSYELVGKSGIFKGRNDTATFASYLIRIRLPDTLLSPSFFSLAMNAPYYRETQIEPEVVQQCGQANFNGTKLAATVVPVPPLAEQHRIVAKVDRLMALVDQLETQLTTSRATAEELMEAVVAELTRSQPYEVSEEGER